MTGLTWISFSVVVVTYYRFKGRETKVKYSDVKVTYMFNLYGSPDEVLKAQARLDELLKNVVGQLECGAISDHVSTEVLEDGHCLNCGDKWPKVKGDPSTCDGSCHPPTK